MTWVVNVSSCSECRVVLESCIGCSNRCVHARRPVPCRAHVPPRSSETVQRRAVEGVAWAALHRLLQLLIGTQRLARAALRGRRDAHCCGASLDADFSSARLADLCLCAAAPRAVASVCWPQTGNLLVSPAAGARASLRLSAPTLPLQPREPCTLCCTPCRTHSAVMPLAPGTQGPRPTRRPDSAVRRRAAMPCSPSAQHRAALSSTSARRDGSPQQP